MIALGNDVVDLSIAPKNGWNYFKRLKSYAFFDEECQLKESKDVSTKAFMQTLWAMKEAVYKSSVKEGNRRRFVPKDFLISSWVKSTEQISASVHWGSVSFNAIATLTSDYVHVLSKLPESKLDFKYEVRTCERTPSANLRRALIECHPGYQVNKDENGVPWLISTHGITKEVSISHHGRFVAFAFQS